MTLCPEGDNIVLSGYCDADYAVDTNDRRSTTGYMFIVGSGAVSRNSKRQQTTATFMVEAEYMASSICIYGIHNRSEVYGN